MGRIRPLSEEMIALISAGEVIENPASVVKELIENALDAGATNVEIAIENGGIDKIVVSDDGHGILREDCPLTVERYATSKIHSREDIEAITTYGFRGEAIASIATVANIRILTHAAEEQIGTELICTAGGKPVIRDASRPVGTTVEVTDLFARVPARRKHLAGPKTEALRVINTVMRHAAVRNDIGFRLLRDGGPVIDCPPGQTRRERLIFLWGAEIARGLIETEYKDEEIRVEGLVVRPPYSRGSRNREYFSILRRPIEDKALSLAAESAFSTLLMRGRYPAFVLDITIDPRRIDVNVHPAKREVRIIELDRITRAIKVAIKRALRQEDFLDKTISIEEFISPDQERVAMQGLVPEASDHRVITHRLGTTERPQLIESTKLSDSTMLQPTGEETIELDMLGGTFRIVGQIHNLYILLEFEEGLAIIDQHAAHERIMYEKLRRQVNTGNVAAQELLEPIVLQLSPDDVERVLTLRDVLENVGYSVASFGGREIIVDRLPEVLGKKVSERELLTLIDEILNLGAEYTTEHFMDEVVKVTACHSAIRAGKPLDEKEIRGLLMELAETPNRYQCPHGRPTIIRISINELERRFKRTG